MREILENKCDCTVKIMPITDYPEYTTLYDPTWYDSGVLTFLYKINVDGTLELIDKNMSIHVVNGQPQRDVYELKGIKDGWYKVVSFIVPTKQTLIEKLDMVDGFDDVEYQKDRLPEFLLRNETDVIIAADEESVSGLSFMMRHPHPSPYRSSGVYYWHEITDINDLIDEINNREVISDYLYGTNIKVVFQDYVNYCNLYKCFINRALSLLNLYKGCDGKNSICNDNYSVKCKSNVDEIQIQIRDYLWMTINAIKYAIECGDYETANRLLNCISTCSGICNESNNEKVSDCGCS